MQTYIVYEPPKPPDNRVKRAERLVFVREGFSWIAALLGPIWMLFHRMWLALFLYVVLMLVLSAVLLAAEASQPWLTLATVAVHLSIGFEAGSLRRWKLERRGWRMLGAVVGPSQIECERRFFQTWLGEESQNELNGAVRLNSQAPVPVGASRQARPETSDSMTGSGGPVGSTA